MWVATRSPTLARPTQTVTKCTAPGCRSRGVAHLHSNTLGRAPGSYITSHAPSADLKATFCVVLKCHEVLFWRLPPCTPAPRCTCLRAFQHVYARWKPASSHPQVHVPEGLTAVDLDIIKLTAQFVARNGKAFLVGLSSREHTNPQVGAGSSYTRHELQLLGMGVGMEG